MRPQCQEHSLLHFFALKGSGLCSGQCGRARVRWEKCRVWGLQRPRHHGAVSGVQV